MKSLRTILTLASSCVLTTLAASSWTYQDGTVQIQGKGSGVGGGVKETIAPNALTAADSLALNPTDTLKVSLTALDGKSGKKPQQAFLTFFEQWSGLEESFAFSVKDSGKAKLELSQKDLPFQFLTSSLSLEVTVVLASPGSAKPFKQRAFDLKIINDAASPPAVPEAPERYAAKPEIHHIFRADAKSSPKLFSLVFTLAVIAALPVLFGGWLYLGGNLDHAGKAFGADPIAHSLFLGSILAMEGVFFMYYTSWNLFQTLPAAAVVGTVAFVSGSRALTEVQERRLAGER